MVLNKATHVQTVSVFNFLNAVLSGNISTVEAHFRHDGFIPDIVRIRLKFADVCISRRIHVQKQLEAGGVKRKAWGK